MNYFTPKMKLLKISEQIDSIYLSTQNRNYSVEVLY